MTQALDQAIAEARTRLGAGQAREAFESLRGLLRFPAPELADRSAFVAAFGAFAEVARAIAGPEFGDTLAAAAADPDDAHALYDAGYKLYEQSLHGIAATALARANRIAPGQPGIVSELVAALEAMMHYGPAAIITAASGLADSDPLIGYLDGFCRLMAGDPSVAPKRIEQLAGATDPNIVHMRESLRGMTLRASALQAAGVELGEHALSAWHAVINGSMLLTESPHGWDEPMRGRYAYLADSAALMRSGIDRVVQLLATRGMPSTVVAAPDRASGWLAEAFARSLSQPLVPFAEGVEPGLVVAWNLDEVGDVAFLQTYRHHRPGDILFAHISDWVKPFPYAPDITTLLAQSVTHPFLGGALRLDPQTQEVAPSAPDARPDAALVDEILSAAPEESQTPFDLVLTIERALRDVPSDHALGIRRTRGSRLRQRAGSPVPSSRFP